MTKVVIFCPNIGTERGRHSTIPGNYVPYKEKWNSGIRPFEGDYKKSIMAIFDKVRQRPNHNTFCLQNVENLEELHLDLLIHPLKDFHHIPTQNLINLSLFWQLPQKNSDFAVLSKFLNLKVLKMEGEGIDANIVEIITEHLKKLTKLELILRERQPAHVICLFLMPMTQTSENLEQISMLQLCTKLPNLKKLHLHQICPKIDIEKCNINELTLSLDFAYLPQIAT